MKLTLEEYYDQLDKHDWFYEYSDDHTIWQKGSEERARLQRVSMQSPNHKKLWDGFNQYHFSGEAFGTDKNPKPKRPKS